MTLSNIKTNQRGFTIVELLIVIVIIAILAAITIVAYTGIQNRAKESAAQGLANNVIKKVEAYYTVNSQYPTLTELDNNYAPGATVAGGGGQEALLDTATQTATQAGAPTTEKQIRYRKCATPDGAVVTYWRASNNTTVDQYLGQATGSSTCS